MSAKKPLKFEEFLDKISGFIPEVMETIEPKQDRHFLLLVENDDGFVVESNLPPIKVLEYLTSVLVGIRNAIETELESRTENTVIH